MNQISIWAFLVCSFLFIFTNADGVDDSVKSSLIQFLAKLSPQNGQHNQHLGWNISSDPCKNRWLGLVCDGRNVSVKKLFLDGLNLSGTLQTSFLCNSKPLLNSLTVLSLNYNNISGEIPADIDNCKQLTRFHVRGNKFHGNLPSSLSKLVNLKRLELSDNNLSGNLPDLSRISGLTMFLAENNKFSGEIPQFEFSNFERFNVSFNNFSGPMPTDGGSYFASDSFMGNPLLCGDPLPTKCHSLKLEEVKPGGEESKHNNKDHILIFSGYIMIGVFLTFIAVFMICKRRKKVRKEDSSNRVAAVDDDGISSKFSTVSLSSEYKTSKAEFSMLSSESGGLSSSLIVLTNPVVNGLKFEDLLKAPAELIGRGNHGSLYKVMFDYGMVFAVKRIKDWGISSDEFMKRMCKIDRVKHPNVLPPLAFYSSDHEKLLVYEFQPNGSLFSLLHGSSSHNKNSFPWISRLEIAGRIAKALAQMHKGLEQEEIAHGNLKSSNILMNWNMEACISEYGLHESTSFRSDVHGFGLILLELLTGKLARDEKGICLADWVRTVLREEWTAEVLDSSLLAEAASEERMVNLLVVAVKCVESSPHARPNMDQVVAMIDSIKEDEQDTSIISILSN
ncbi:probable inactive receptor kinase At2g26730 [Cucurbita pepo subsp. pepo]|uniref:probable inactive receptor kinase At2g26730 n=1 Tax=Cucurbita pepo subsp. pepo TaxID=3664 RepID=UPI000C9D38D5|nr:probable inactive receptor kinase At2g26730 [Cucurbita pepo subsp. pepo]